MGVFLVFGHFAVSTPSGEPGRGKGQKNLARENVDLNGEWQQESRVVLGKRMDDPPGIRLRVAGGFMTTSVRDAWWRPAESVGQEYYRIDANNKPMHIDTSVRTDWREVESKGILLLDKDKLILCFSAKNKPRPTIFATGSGAGMGEVLLTYKRVIRGKFIN